MTPYYEGKWGTIYYGDCREILPQLDKGSAIVTDPPYELGFMGKSWDSKGISFQKETWGIIRQSCLSGAMLLSFGGTRTFHRIAVAIEDAGWEYRDTAMWVYGSGFPKSLNIGKAVDKINGEAGRLLRFVEWMRTTGLKAAQINNAIGKSDVGSHYLRRDQPAIPTRKLWAKLRLLCGNVPAWVDELVERIEAEREVLRQESEAPRQGGSTPFDMRSSNSRKLTKGNSVWEGYGTALKPAYEPIILAMNPLDGTFANNALKHGVAGLNIDECRIAYEKGGDIASNPLKRINEGHTLKCNDWLGDKSTTKDKADIISQLGRFPANFIHDGSQMVMELFPQTSTHKGIYRNNSRFDPKSKGWGYESNKLGYVPSIGDNGSAARFFYCAKASKAERDRGLEGLEARQYSHDGRNKPIENPYQRNNSVARNNHPTVKPLALMTYLVKLVKMPEYNLIIDPFMGSGTTLLACIKLGIPCVGIDNDEKSCEIATKRCCQEVVELV